jgi:ferric-dicitrate binding protein FerR (iron transport regulator)
MENYQQDNIPYHLILDEMERQLSPAEAAELEQWKDASPENLATYNTLREAGDRLALLNLYQTTDVDRAWSKMSASVQQPKRKGKLRLLLGGLAAAAIITGVSILLFNWFSPGQMIYRTANGVRQIALPDGSTVFLNEQSAISYTKRSFHRKRQVKLLEGEAYFEVVHDEKNEFHVELGDVVVRDIGTSFDIKSDAGKIQVIVNEGAVSMEHQLSQKVVLTANQMAIFNRGTKSISYAATAPINYKAWQDKKLRYVQTPLSLVVQDLNRIYGTRVIFQDSTLKERKLTTYINQKTEDQIMYIIATSLQIKIIKKDSTFIISR